MRILADENFPRLGVEALREQRVLVTLDKDFGEIAFRKGLPATSGIVLLRVSPPLPAQVAKLATRLFSGETCFQGEFIVADEKRLRRRFLPSALPDVD